MQFLKGEILTNGKILVFIKNYVIIGLENLRIHFLKSDKI